MTKRYVIVPLFHLLHPIGHKSVESYPVRLFLPRTGGGYVKKKIWKSRGKETPLRYFKFLV